MALARVSGAAWTRAHRAFPLLTGLGVSVALALVPWTPGPTEAALLAFPLVIAPLLSSLGILWTPSVRWLGPRHAFVALAAVATAMVPTILAALLTHASLDRIGTRPGSFTAVIATTGALAGWLALHFERLAEAQTGLTPLGRTRWSPRRWGLAGASGVTIALAALAVPAWAFFIGTGIGGGFGIVWYYARYAEAAAVLALAIGLGIEAVMAQHERLNPLR